MKLFLKKLSLAIIGIILSLVLLECGLRLAGWTISSYQQYKNNKALRNKSQYTIMCLGESTTAWQYPIQLQKILDSKFPNKFTIVDKGLPNTRLQHILDSLDENINKYNPDITICMMSINDQQILNVDRKYLNDFNEINLNENKKNLFDKIKTYKLLKLVKRHIYAKFFQSKLVFAKEINKTNKIKELETSLEYYHSLGGVDPKIPTIAKQLLEIDSTNEIAIHNLCLYNWHIVKNEDIAYKIAMFGIENNINVGELYRIAITYRIKHNIPMDDLIDTILNDTNELIISDSYSAIAKYLTEEQKNIILNKLSNINDRYLSFKGLLEFNRGNYQKAQEYFYKAEQIRLLIPNQEIVNLYKLIVKKLIDNNIKVICMQYPVRSILPLQEQLKNEPYYDKITFISNEKLFKDALMKKNYDDLFIDQFAMDFGHCSDLGNTMIAENIVNTLEKILNLKQN